MIEYHRILRLVTRFARWMIALVVASAVWVFGCADSWAFLSACLVILLATGIWLLGNVCYPERGIGPPSLIFVMLLILGFAFIQIVPLPRAVVSIVNPRAVKVVDAKANLFSEMGIDSSEDKSQDVVKPVYTLSLSPDATITGLCLWSAYICVFIVMANGIRKWRHVYQVAGLLLVSGFLLAVIAIIHKLSGSQEILWIRIPYYGGNIFGSFTNRNHYAYFMNLVLALGFGLMFAERRPLDLEDKSEWREKLAMLTSSLAGRRLLLVFVMAIMGGSVLLSLSRGGIMSLAVGLGMIVFVSRLHQKKGKGLLFAFLLLIAGVVVWLGWEPIVSRFGALAKDLHDPLNNSRFTATADTFKMFLVHPLTGTGFGSFQYAFPAFQSHDLQFGRFLHAHNDWAQWLAEGGVIGSILIAALIVLFLMYLRSRYQRSERRAQRFVLGASVGLIAAGLHGFVDYGVHKPANGFMLAALSGIMAAVVRMGSRRPQKATGAAPATSSFCRGGRCMVICVLLCGMTVLGFSEFDDLRGAVAFPRMRQLHRLTHKLKNRRQKETVMLMGLDESALIIARNCPTPIEARETAMTLLDWTLSSDVRDDLRLVLSEAALESAILAVQMAPADNLPWIALGYAFAARGLWAESDLAIVRERELNPEGEAPVLLR